MISETNERADESPERHDEVTTEKAVEPSPKAEDSSETSNVDSERIEPKSESMLLDKPSESTKPAGTDASLDMIEPASIEEAQQPEPAPAGEVETSLPVSEVTATADSEADGTAPESEESSVAEEPAEASKTPSSGPPPQASPSASDDDDKDDPSANMDWYILKVQSNREDRIRDSLLRRAKIAALEHFFGNVIVPTETVTEFKNGKKRVVKRKLYPGYIVVNMEINDDTWFLVRDTPGIGDFTGAGGSPVPMQPHEVSRILARQEEKTEAAPKLKISFKPGDRVKINEGTFENFEGDVDRIDETNGRVTVMINIFGRSTPVELEYWQVAAI